MTEGKFMDIKLSKTTYIFGLRLWIVIGIVMGSVIFFILFLLLLWSTSKKRYRRPTIEQLPSIKIPMFSKEIKEVGLDQTPDLNPPKASNGQALSPSEIAGGNKLSLGVVSFGYPRSSEANRGSFLVEEGGKETPVKQEGRLHKLILEGEKQALLPFPYINSDSHESSDSPAEPSLADRNLSINTSEVSHLGWGYSYSLRDIEVATDKLSDSNKLGEGGYGIVYRGHLPDGTFVAVKNLLNNRGQAEREFRVEVEAIGRVRHKNLVSLIGFCAEGIYRMLVYEYVENGNLYHWLHGALAENGPIPWDMRMHIAIGTAKGLAYLHDGLEPKVVHRDVKSSNILIDGQWNAKVSDFGLAKLLGSEKSHVTTRVMGTFGYVAPEYACTGLLTERSDVYSFGVLLMELITGRHPIDYRRPAGEINLVDWLKSMVGSQHSEDVIDPRLAVKPSARSLKRALLVALRCVDPDAEKRPKMGHVVHMLEADDPTFHDDCRIARAKNLSK